MNDVLSAIDRARVGVFAFHDSGGRPLAVPVTPYVDGASGCVVVTSTLAYTRKAEMVRRDGRVALLAGETLVRAVASVYADVSGDVFVARYLDQELRKYPPGRALVEVPDYRNALAWYFGRAIIRFEPAQVEARAGEDFATLTAHDGDGRLAISPLVPAPDASADSFAVGPSADGAASVLFHRESADYTDMRWLRLEGDVRAGVFSQRRRVGTLDATTGGSPDYRALEARARTIMKEWDQA